MEASDNVFKDLGNDDLRLASVSGKFTDDYKQQAFTIWYNEGKPNASILLDKLPHPETNYHVKPNYATVLGWIKSPAWVQRAKELDLGVRQSVDVALVQTKVEMMKRHVKIATDMQELAIEYLQNHIDDMSAPAAVRLLISMIQIERESVGIPGAIAKLTQMSDEQLLEEVKKLVEETPLEDIENEE